MDDKDNINAEQEAELLEKIKADILADDEHIYYFLIPLVLRDAHKKEVPTMTHYEFIAYMTRLVNDPKELLKYKQELEKVLDFKYIYACSLLYTNTTNARAGEMIKQYIQALYDIDLIQDADIKQLKTIFFKSFLSERITNIGDIFLKTINGFKAIHNAQDVAIIDDAEYEKRINDANYIKFKFKDTINSKDDILAFIKQNEKNERTFHLVARNIQDFTAYLLATGTERQTLENYDNRFKENGATSYVDKNKVMITGVFFRNIYTNYDVDTEAVAKGEKVDTTGLDNFTKRLDAVDKKYGELWQRIQDNNGDITLEELTKLLSFNDAEADLLSKDEKDELAGLESVSTPIKPNSMTYTTNKIHQNLSKIETLTEINNDILPISLSKKKGDIVAIASMETMQDAIYKLNLTPFDELILDASKNLFKLNKEINTESVCDYITGNTGTRPNKAMLDDIEKSILTLSGKILRLDYGTQKHLKGKHKGEEIEIHFTAPLLPIKAVQVKYKGHKKTFYRLIGTYEENEYFKFTDALGQLTSTKTLYLKAGDKVRINKENTLINNYLAKQITLIKRGSLDTNKISYDKIYALCGIDNTDEKDSNALIQRKNRIRANVSYLLQEKKKLGFIKHYEEYKETQGTAHRVAGIEIFTEDDTKKK